MRSVHQAALALALGACSAEGLSANRAVRMADDHLEHFTWFEGWSERVVAADPAFRSRERLEETLFAPLRREDPVWGAWLGWGRGVQARWGRLEHPPKSLRWTRIRVPEVGEVEVTCAKIPDPRASRPVNGPVAPCILLRRPSSERRTTLGLTLAYRATAPDEL